MILRHLEVFCVALRTFEKVPFSTFLKREEDKCKEDQLMETLLTVGSIVLVFALITAILVPVMKLMTRYARLEYELRRDGVTVPGWVIGRSTQVDYLDRRGYDDTHLLYYLGYTYRFNGVVYGGESQVRESDYEAHPEGSPISVICHPRHPERSYLLLHGRLNGTIAY